MPSRARHSACRRAWFALTLCAAALTGCGAGDMPDPAGLLGDYGARLARALDSELPPAAATRVPTWPGSAALVPADAPRITGTLRLPADAGRCGLLGELRNDEARGNGVARQLLSEMRLLRALGQCEALTAGDLDGSQPGRREFAAAIRAQRAQRQLGWPRAYWDATFGAAELRDFFSVGTQPLRGGEITAVLEAADALDWLAALGRLTPEAPLPAPEVVAQNYYRLAGHRAGGRAWLGIDLGLRELARGSALLEAAATRGACGDRTAVRDLYDGMYRQRVEPWLEEAGRGAGALAQALEALWGAQRVAPPPALAHYRARVWADVPGSLLTDYGIAVERHTRAWAAWQAACGN